MPWNKKDFAEKNEDETVSIQISKYTDTCASALGRSYQPFTHCFGIVEIRNHIVANSLYTSNDYNSKRIQPNCIDKIEIFFKSRKFL